MPMPSYYDTLQVKRTSTPEEIKAAYRKLALKWHPERATDVPAIEAEAKFAEVAEAYEVLVHPARKAIYDQYGAPGLKQGIPDGFGGVKGGSYRFSNNALEIFASFFGTSSPFADIMGAMGDEPPAFYGELTGMVLPMVPKKPEAVSVAPTPRTAHCFFLRTGPSPSVRTQRRIHSHACAGGARGPRDACRAVQRRGEEGRVRETRAAGAARVETPHRRPTRPRARRALTGAGAGRSPNQADETTTEELASLHVTIKPGMEDGTPITFPSAGDEGVGIEPADVDFVLETVPDAAWSREGSTLYYTAELSLTDALCGTVLSVPTLDGRTLSVPITQIVSPGSTKTVPGEGMPTVGGKGDLVIQFTTVFPQSLTLAQKAAVKKALA